MNAVCAVTCVPLQVTVASKPTVDVAYGPFPKVQEKQLLKFGQVVVEEPDTLAVTIVHFRSAAQAVTTQKKQSMYNQDGPTQFVRVEVGHVRNHTLVEQAWVVVHT